MATTVERSQDFARDVFPVVVAWARRCRLDEDGQADAAGLAWYYWKDRQSEQSPTVWARAAVRAVRAGRVLPGTGTRCTDVTRHCRSVGGAGMAGVRDRRPGPVQVAEEREAWERWLATLTGRERHLLAWVEAGVSGEEIAARLGLTPSRVSQLRRQMAARYEV